MGFLRIIITTLIMCAIGGGGGFLWWLFTRKKRMTWKAKVYQLGEGVRPPHIDKKTGKPLSNIRLSDLKPYTKDVIERIEKDAGITIFRLVKLNKIVPAITSDSVEFWGEKEKEVAVLLMDENATILRKGYDRTTGNSIFTPLPSERINMIKGEITLRKDRARQQKSILEAITPWIVVGVCMIGMVAMTYELVDGWKKVGDQSLAGADMIANAIVQSSKILNNKTCVITQEQIEFQKNKLGPQEPAPVE